MKLSKMILGLETHTYSPEQNKLFFINGLTFRVPGITKIKDAKNKLFPKAKYQRFATITVTYPKSMDCSYLDKTYSGGFNTTNDLAAFIEKVKEKHFIDTDQLLFKPEGVEGIIKPKIDISFTKLSKMMA